MRLVLTDLRREIHLLLNSHNKRECYSGPALNLKKPFTVMKTYSPTCFCIRLRFSFCSSSLYLVAFSHFSALFFSKCCACDVKLGKMLICLGFVCLSICICIQGMLQCSVCSFRSRLSLTSLSANYFLS